MSQVDEALIHAWLDGQLSPDEAERVEQLVATDAAWGAAAADARGMIAAASRILGALDHVPVAIPAGTRGAAAAAAARPMTVHTEGQMHIRRWWQNPAMRIAAVMVLAVGVGTYVWRQAPEIADVPTAIPASDGRRDAAPPTVAAVPTVAAARPQAAASTAQERGAVTKQDGATKANATAPPPQASAVGATTAVDARAGAGVGAGVGTRAVAGATSDSVGRPLNATENRVGLSGAARPVRDAALEQVAAKAVGVVPDNALAGCWEPIDTTRRQDERSERDQVVLRFIGPSLTDVPALAQRALPIAPPLALQSAPGARIQNSVPRKLNDSTYVTEWIQSDRRVQLTFFVRGDTLRGMSSRVGGARTLADGVPMLAVRRACPR